MRPTIVAVMPIAEQRGGAELNLRQFAERSAASEITLVVVFLRDGPMVSEFRAMGIHVEVIDAGRLSNTAKFAKQ